MSAMDELFSHFLELCPKTFGDCPAVYSETIVLPGSATDMREPEKVKRFGLPFSPIGAVCFREPSKLDEPGLFAVDFKSEGGESFLHFFKETFSLVPVLKPMEIVGIANIITTVALFFRHSVTHLSRT
jgi:hypothetical protein